MNAIELADVIVETALGERAEPKVRALVDRALFAELVEDFKLGPIFPLGSERPARLAISNQNEIERWRRDVIAAFPHPKLERFIDSVPPSARRMLDTDGTRALVYLDDLQDVDAGLSDSEQRPLMFVALDLETGGVSRGTRHVEPPRELLSGLLRERLEGLVGLGAVGLWSIRWSAKKPCGLIWVSESRWRKNFDQAISIGARLGSHAGTAACARAARDHGLIAYPDAIEARLDGSWDLTLGFARVG